MEILEQQVVCAGIHNEDTIDTEQAKLKKKGLAKPEKFYFDNRGVRVDGKVKEVTIRS